MSVCVPVHAKMELGRGGVEGVFQSVPYVYREACSRFKGVACGVFHTGTTSAFGREVNWKSIGASVDRSDLERWAMVSRLAGKHASTRRFPVGNKPFGTECVDDHDHHHHTPFHHEVGGILS